MLIDITIILGKFQKQKIIKKNQNVQISHIDTFIKGLSIFMNRSMYYLPVSSIIYYVY